MTAEEYLKSLDVHNQVWDLADEYEYTEKQLLKFAEDYSNEQLRLHGVVRSVNLPNINAEFTKARKQFAKACENYLNSKEHKAMIEAFKKVGAID